MRLPDILDSNRLPTHKKTLKQAIKAGHAIDLIHAAVGNICARLPNINIQWASHPKLLVSLVPSDPLPMFEENELGNVIFFGHSNAQAIQGGWRTFSTDSGTIIQCMEVTIDHLAYASSIYTKDDAFNPIDSLVSPFRKIMKSAKDQNWSGFSLLVYAEGIQNLTAVRGGFKNTLDNDNIVVFREQCSTADYPQLAEEIIRTCGGTTSANEIATTYGI